MNRTTLIGLVVLGLVAGGLIWARVYRAPPAGRMASSSADDRTLPDVTSADASVDADGVRITLSLSPRPPVALAATRVRVRAEADGVPVALEGGRVSFEMTMPMGDHRYVLVAREAGWQEANVVLPRCPSGKRRWYATVEGTVGGRPRTARFRLDLAPPAAAR